MLRLAVLLAPLLAAAAALFLGIFTGTQDNDDALTEQDEEGETAALSEFGALALGSELVTDLGQIEGAQE